MRQPDGQQVPQHDEPPWRSWRSDPWTRAKDTGRYRAAACDNENIVVGLTLCGLALLVFAVVQLVTLNFAIAGICLLLGAGSILAAWGWPTFLYTADTPAHRLQPGHLVKTQPGTVSEVLAVYDDHGAGRVEAALADGRVQAYDAGSKAVIAIPYSTRIFRQIGLDAPPFDFRPIDTRVLGLLDVADQQMIENRGSVDRDEFRTDLAAVGIESDAIDDAVRERLLSTERTGLGSRRRTSLQVTDAGFVTLQAHLRKQGIEMHPDAAPSQPEPTVHVEGVGNIVTAGVNSVITAQVGDRNSADVTTQQSGMDPVQYLADLLLVLKNPPAELRSIAGEDLLQPLGIALEQELDREEIDPSRVGRLVRSVRELVGDVIPSVMGSAAWSALIKMWA